MGDSSDMHDLGRFMRSGEGQEHLGAILCMLKGRRINDVELFNNTCRISLILHLDDGCTFETFRPDLEIEYIRATFDDVLEREYYRDFPERS